MIRIMLPMLVLGLLLVFAGRGRSRWRSHGDQRGFAVLVPAGTNHNIINTGRVPLKFYTLYAPPNHRDGVVHHTCAEEEKDNEHFDGKTTE